LISALLGLGGLGLLLAGRGLWRLGGLGLLGLLVLLAGGLLDVNLLLLLGLFLDLLLDFLLRVLLGLLRVGLASSLGLLPGSLLGNLEIKKKKKKKKGQLGLRERKIKRSIKKEEEKKIHEDLKPSPKSPEKIQQENEKRRKEEKKKEEEERKGKKRKGKEKERKGKGKERERKRKRKRKGKSRSTLDFWSHLFLLAFCSSVLTFLGGSLALLFLSLFFLEAEMVSPSAGAAAGAATFLTVSLAFLTFWPATRGTADFTIAVKLSEREKERERGRRSEKR